MSAKLTHIWRVKVSTQTPPTEHEVTVLTGTATVGNLNDFMDNVKEASKHYLGSGDFALKSVEYVGSAVGTQGMIVNRPQSDVQITEEGEVILKDPKRWSILAGLENAKDEPTPAPGALKKLENLLAKHPELKNVALRMLSEEAQALEDAAKTAGAQ